MVKTHAGSVKRRAIKINYPEDVLNTVDYTKYIEGKELLKKLKLI